MSNVELLAALPLPRLFDGMFGMKDLHPPVRPLRCRTRVARVVDLIYKLKSPFAKADRSASNTATRIATGVVVGGLLAIQPATAATPSAKDALQLKPVQANVDYEIVEPAALAKCTVADLEHDDWSGWEVRSGDGTMLRRFADTNGDNKVDLWCYFNYGVEVYRDIDRDFNTKADQYRWLGTAGTRWGIDENEDGKIDSWKQISPEEVTAEVVGALADHDAARFARLLATGKELESIGLGSETARRLATKASRAAKEFSDFSKRQKAVGRDAKWVQFAAATPGVVPSGTEGATADFTVYENAVAMFEDKSGSGQLLVGTIIRVNDAWRIVDLPAVGENGESVAQSSGNFFTPGGMAHSAASLDSGMGAQSQQLVTDLEEIDRKLSSVSNPKELAKLHETRAQLVSRLIKATDNPSERDAWTRQLVDTVSMATQSGVYPDGIKQLQVIVRSLGENNDSLKSYTEYMMIGAEYALRQTPDADFAEVQKWYLETLTEFVDRYPRMPESAQAMLQLALSKEFEDKEKDALGYYKKVAVAFPGTDTAEKAEGAVRRLESVGQVIDLQGNSIDGKPFRLAQLRGRPVVLHYWATWCEPCKQDMKLLRALQARYQKAGLVLVGVNVDATSEMAKGFLKQNPLPWIQLFDDGGLESSDLAKAFGVQTLPTMMLIDDRGRVVRHNVRAAELESELDKLAK